VIFAVKEAHYASAHGAVEFPICRRTTLAECAKIGVASAARGFTLERGAPLYKPGYIEMPFLTK
jgi:predicted carbohydrate-binding protein with CBM5 and CBM33 domain